MDGVRCGIRRCRCCTAVVGEFPPSMVSPELPRFPVPCEGQSTLEYPVGMAVYMYMRTTALLPGARSYGKCRSRMK